MTHPDLQMLAVLPVVAACAVYAGWTLMPAALRRPLAQALARLPLFARMPAVVRATRVTGGCGCDGCDAAAPAKAAGHAQVVRIVRRSTTRRG